MRGTDFEKCTDFPLSGVIHRTFRKEYLSKLVWALPEWGNSRNVFATLQTARLFDGWGPKAVRRYDLRFPSSVKHAHLAPQTLAVPHHLMSTKTTKKSTQN
jgi:hypothetical protein